jgi:hypothetical protein
MANISNINDFFVVDSAGLKAVVGADLANGNGSPYVGTDFTVVGRDASSPVANLWLSNFTHKSYILISDNSSNFIIRDSAAGNRLTIDTDGKVGIGTISPGAKLDVNDTNKAINTKGNLFVSTTDTLAADKGGQISLGGVWAGTSQIQFAGIAGRKENATSGNAGGYLQLSTTASSGGTLTERMRIDSSGNVLIGTAIDAGKVTIQNDTANAYALRVLRSTSTTQGLGGFYEGASNEGILYLVDGSNGLNAKLSSSGDSYFNGGNVGIGTPSPVHLLQVKSSYDDFITKIENDLGSEGGNGLWVDTRWNVANNVPFKVTSNSGNSPMMIIKGNGNVGIGTSTPDTKLHIYGSSTVSEMYLGEDAAVDKAGILKYNQGNGTGTGSVQLGNYGDNLNTTGVTIKKGGDVGIGTSSPAGKFEIKSAASSYTTAPAITFTDDTGVADSRWILGNIATNYGNFVLAESDSATTVNYSPRITVIPGGNVGIGTSSPGKLFSVIGADGRNVTTYLAEIVNNDNTSDQGHGLLVGGGNNANHHLFQVSASGSAVFSIKGDGYVGIGNISGAGARTKLGVSFNVGGSAANLAESVTYATMEMYPYRTGSTYGMFFGNKGTAAGYIQTANNTGNDKGEIHINPFGGGVGIGVGNASAGALLDVVAPNSGGATRQDMFRLLQSGQNTLSCYMYGGTTDLVQLHVSGTEQHLSLTTGGAATATTLTGIHIRSGGNVGINTQNATGNLTVESGGNQLHLRASTATAGKYWNLDVASNNIFYIVNNSSNGVFITDGGTSWTGISDESVKENIKPLENVLDKIKDYRCVEYNLKNVPNDKKIGFIAQDWENDFAPIISKDDEGLLGMKYTETIPVLLKAIQELKAEIEILKKK